MWARCRISFVLLQTSLCCVFRDTSAGNDSSWASEMTGLWCAHRRLQVMMMESYDLCKTKKVAVSHTHSWLFGVMVITPDWESVGCEFKYRNFYHPQRSCEGYVFTPVCHSVHRGGEYLTRYTPRDQVLPPCDQVLPPCDQVLPSPVTRYSPPWPGTPPCDQVLPPVTRYSPRRRPLLRTVRILLECILVVFGNKSLV